jgi:hypothetical protein
MGEGRIDPKEMMRLRELLISAGVRYMTDDESDRWRTYSPDFETVADKGCVRGFSVILNPYSYGSDVNLLEAWAQGDKDPSGWLSTDNVMHKLREAGMVG